MPRLSSLRPPCVRVSEGESKRTRVSECVRVRLPIPLFSVLGVTFPSGDTCFLQICPILSTCKFVPIHLHASNM